jgi:hypothetical protein
MTEAKDKMSSKSKTNALDTLRALIAERQQYDQWIATLESKRDGTPEHVFNRVFSDYRSRLDRVVGEIRGHSEELQLSINALSSRLGEVAKDEEAKRDSVQEAELRAAVGEYDVAQWESMRAEASRQLEKIAADRASLEEQLAELESIRKLSEMSPGSAEAAPGAAPQVAQPAAQAVAAPTFTPTSTREEPARKTVEPAVDRPKFSDVGWPARDIVDVPATTPINVTPSTPQSSNRVSSDPAAAAPRPSASPPPPPPQTQPPKRRTPTGKDAQISSGFSKPVPTPPEGRPEVNKTLKCPECGTPNYPTEWYCERCGGELATM